MPVTNNNKDATPIAKYSVFLCDKYAGSYTRNDRCIVQNFRTQLRGLGAAGIVILPKNQVNEDVTGEIKVNQYVKILDTSIYFDKTYQSVGDELFFGAVTSVTSDIYSGLDDDRGFASVEEIGGYYSKKPIIWVSKPQVFNPVVSGKAYGNRNPVLNGENSEFETDISKMATVTMNGVGDNKFTSDTSTSKANLRVWSLQQFLDYMADIHNVEIEYPWTYDNKIIDKKTAAAKVGITDAKTIAEIDTKSTADKKNNEDAYNIFKDTLEIRSFDHYNGRSFQELLQDVIKSPFEWFFTNYSSSKPTIQIINSSPVAAIEYYPAGQLIAKTIDSSITTNFNITKQDEVYDTVIYRGDNILVAGTASHWNNNGSQTMDRGWTTLEEQDYVKAKDYTAKAIAASVRSADKKVYRQFVYRHMAQPCPIQIAKKLNEKGTKYTQAPLYPNIDGQELYDMVPFFPSIDFFGYSKTVPFVRDTPLVSTSLESHKTAPLLEIKWSETLPWVFDGEKDLRKPFLVAQGTEEENGVNKFFTWDITRGGQGDTCSLTHTPDGYKLELGTPEVLAKYTPQMFTLSNTLVDTPPYYWSKSSISEKNPADTANGYLFFTSYKLMAATIAGYSDQFLEYTVNNPKSTTSNRVKIIEDPSLQCWFAHAGTIKQSNSVGERNVSSVDAPERIWTNGYDRFDKDTFIRNDFKKVFNLANNTANWLFTPKISAKIEMSLTNYNGGWSVGELIGQVTDDKIKRTINTLVASVEYDCVSNRINISTSFPEMPVLKKLAQSPMSKSHISPSSDSKESLISDNEHIITKEKYPTHGYVSGGSPPPAQPSSIPVITILNGSDDQKTFGMDAILVNTTPITTVSVVTSSADLFLTGAVTFPTGFGVGRHVTAGYVYVYNKDFGQMLFAGDKILSAHTQAMSGGIVNGSHYTFVAYIPELLL